MKTLIRKSLIILFVLFISPVILLGQIQNQLKWEELPPLPDKEGFAGMFAGVSNDALLCIGGANFPDKMPWEAGVKKWYDRIYILEKNASSWKIADEKLVNPLGYGVSVTYKDKIILVGGNNDKSHYSNVYTLHYQDGKVKMDSLVSLPFPLANMTGTLVGDILFIAGGNSNSIDSPGKFFLALNLAEELSEQKWQALDSWPGSARIMAVSSSLNNNFFLFSGIDMVNKADGTSERKILKDAYKFVPEFNGIHLKGGKWTVLSDMPRAVAAGPSPAPTTGSDHILFPGGLDEITAKHKDPKTFPGFITSLLAYHVESDTWLNFGNLPKGDTRVTVPAVKWGQKWVIPNGEIGPGKRSSKVFALGKDLSFGWINWAMLFFYLGLMVWIGFLFDKKGGQTTSNFFTANGKIPWWAAGLSIYGAQFSAISFMALPAIVYAKDWSLALGAFMVVGTIPLVIRYYIPFFRRLSITSAYEYLEVRFNANVRVLGSLTFILFQLVRMGIVLFLPAVAIASVTGIDIYLLIFIMGVICILYTVMGGIEAVIWTDVVQVIILMGGAILCLVIAIVNVDGGFWGVISKGIEAKKFTMIHLGWEPDRLVLWVAIIGFFFLNLIPFTSDQTIVQRYLTVKDEAAAGKSLWTHALMAVPAVFIFYGLGTVLYVFYHENTGSIPSDQVGEILPYFVVQELPVGIAGLIIAGIFAASQSTLSGSMNSVSAVYVTDIYPRFGARTDRDNLRTAKLVTILVGLFGVASAMIIAVLHIEFIFDLFQEILGIIGGALAGVFILGIFTKRANPQGVIWGIIIGVLVVLMTKTYTDISVYLYGAISVLTTVIMGYLISLFTPQKKNLQGLTYLTLDKESGVER